VSEQEIVHLPEGVLFARGLRSFRGELGAGVDVVQRQMPPDVADVAEFAQELADDRFRHSAVGAFKVAVLDDCHRCDDRAAHVVALRVDVDVEVGQRLRSSEQRADAQPSRQQRGGAEEQPGDERRAYGGTEDAELRLLQVLPVECEGGDEQRDREADPGDRAAAGNGRPTDRRSQPAAAQPGEEPGAAEDSHRLADHVAEQDPERDRRREALGEEAAVDRDARVREREQRHDHVARPGVIELLKALVARCRRPELHAGHACQFRRGLLAELSKPLRGALEARPWSRVGVDQ
jgi:hypothetical protein